MDSRVKFTEYISSTGIYMSINFIGTDDSEREEIYESFKLVGNYLKVLVGN